MILLKKKNADASYFNFDKILEEGYTINEQPNIIAVKQFANGRRKKIVTDYTDVVIKINVGCFDGNTLATYLEKLQDGEYEYYSLKDKIYKKANFITTIPEQVVENASSNIIVADTEIVLEKSGDVL